MIKQKQDIIDSLTSIAFIVIFFLMISAFSDKSVKQDNNIVKHELVSNLCAVNSKATAIYPVQLPSFQKEWILINDKLNINFSDTNLKIFSDNLRVAEMIICLQKVQLSIRPILTHRYYHHLLPLDSKELPILS